MLRGLKIAIGDARASTERKKRDEKCQLPPPSRRHRYFKMHRERTRGMPRRVAAADEDGRAVATRRITTTNSCRLYRLRFVQTASRATFYRTFRNLFTLTHIIRSTRAVRISNQPLRTREFPPPRRALIAKPVCWNYILRAFLANPSKQYCNLPRGSILRDLNTTPLPRTCSIAWASIKSLAPSVGNINTVRYSGKIILPFDSIQTVGTIFARE